MEFWLRCSTISKHDYLQNEMPLDLCEAWWIELGLHYKHENNSWQSVKWCIENNIPFTIRAYECFSDTQYDTVENKEHYTQAVEEMMLIPASIIPDLWFWFINIPNKDHALMYKITFGNQ